MIGEFVGAVVCVFFVGVGVSVVVGVDVGVGVGTGVAIGFDVGLFVGFCVGVGVGLGASVDVGEETGRWSWHRDIWNYDIYCIRVVWDVEVTTFGVEIVCGCVSVMSVSLIREKCEAGCVAATSSISKFMVVINSFNLYLNPI
jgi:hypothetical protein